MRRVIPLVCVLLLALLVGWCAQRSTEEDPSRQAERSAPEARLPTTERRARTEARDAEDRTPAKADVASTDDAEAGEVFHDTSGTVKWPDGTPAADALVLLGDLDNTDLVQWTDETGRFGFEVMAHYSQVTAVAQREGKQWRGAQEVDGEAIDVDIELHPATASERVLLVHVRGYDGGAVDHAVAEVAAGTVRVPPRAQRDVVMHAANGWILVAPERWKPMHDLRLIVHSPRDSGGNPLAYAAALVEIRGYETEPIEVTLPRGRSIEGTVVDATGAPAPGARVVLDPPDPDGFDNDHMGGVTLETRTDETGRYEFHGLGDGPFRVSAPASPGEHGGASRYVPRGVPEPLVLRPVIDVRIRVTDEGGAPIQGARSSGLGLASTTSDADGVLPVRQVAAGDRIGGSVLRDGFAEVRLKDWRPQDGEVVEVTLKRALPIRGQVLGPDGAPLRGVFVSIQVDGASSWDRPKWHRDQFEFEGLAVGSVVSLWLRDDGREFPKVTASAGDSDVVLRWPVEDRFTIHVENSHVEQIALRTDDAEVATIQYRWSALASFDPAQLPPRVDVLIGPTQEGHSTLLLGMEARGFHRVALTPGVRLDVDVQVPDDVDVRWVSCYAVCEGGFELELPLRARNRFTAEGLPRGRWTVRAEAGSDRPHAQRKIEIDDDTTVELDLRND